MPHHYEYSISNDEFPQNLKTLVMSRYRHILNTLPHTLINLKLKSTLSKYQSKNLPMNLKNYHTGGYLRNKKIPYGCEVKELLCKNKNFNERCRNKIKYKMFHPLQNMPFVP